MSDNASAPSVPAELGFWMHFEFRVSPADLQNSLRPIPSLPAGLCIADAWSGGGTRVVRREAPNEAGEASNEALRHRSEVSKWSAWMLCLLVS